MKGYIYILINPVFPGFLKVGKTTKKPEDRARELSSTSGVPSPFAVVWDEFVSDCDQVERLVHQHFAKDRIRNEREFFAISVKQAISIISYIANPFLCDPDSLSIQKEAQLQIQNKPILTQNNFRKSRSMEEELILLAEDSIIIKATEPPDGINKTIARITFEVLTENPYRFTEKELFEEVHYKRRERKDLKIESYLIKRSALLKEYGWCIHRNQDGKLALVPVNSEKYFELKNSIKTVRSYRKRKA